jgi:hypothetical protein
MEQYVSGTYRILKKIINIIFSSYNIGGEERLLSDILPVYH